MRWTSGEAVVPAVVGVLFGVGERGTRRSKSKEVKSPTRSGTNAIQNGSPAVPSALVGSEALEAVRSRRPLLAGLVPSPHGHNQRQG